MHGILLLKKLWINVKFLFYLANIKSVSPLKITRKIRAVVPVANSGVPFMPKTAKSEELQNLHFFSKHKWALDG